MIIQQVLTSTGLDNFGVYLRDGPFSKYIGIIIFYASETTHWVTYINEKICDIYVCAPPQKLSKVILKSIGLCLFSDYKTQGLTSKRDFFCASYCLYIIYLTKVIGIDLKTAVLNLYYQMIQ